MLNEINGLPAHVLLIHAIVVLAPIGALFTVLSAVLPKARRRIGVYGPITCLIVLVLTPITTNAGEWLEDRVTDGQPAGSAFVEKVEKHADLGDTFLFFAIGLFVVSAAVWWLGRRADAVTPSTEATEATEPAAVGGGTDTLTRTAPARTELPPAVRYAVSAVAIVVSVATVVQLVRIGDSGATATWGR